MPTPLRTRGAARYSFGRKSEEYLADFALIAKRVLVDGTLEYRIFKAHYLLGADAALVRHQLRLDRQAFTATCDSIRQRLGRAFYETEPFSLYPVVEYFSPGNLPCDPPVERSPASAARTFWPVVPPLAPIARSVLTGAQ
jgi:hypothetical protein